MDSSYNRFKKIDVKYSVTDSTLQLNNTVNDGLQPYTLIEWLNNAEIIITDPDKYIENYNAYLREWQTVTGAASETYAKTVHETYISLLKEIVINYSTLEEKRFFANIDYTNKAELDPVIPFFAKRIKEIILFIAKKRDSIKYQKIRNSFTGTRDGIKKVLRDKVIRLLSGDNIDAFKGQTLPDVKKIIPNFRVEVNELYDLSEDYFDVYNSSNTKTI